MSKPKILSVNKRWLPELPQSLSERGAFVTVVLVEGDIGDYSAYLGLGQDAEMIAMYGDKISFNEAKAHFPDIDRAKYRT